MPAPLTLEDLLAHAGCTRRLAGALAADPATAEDLVQDTWVTALRARPATDRPLAPWLAEVLRNLFFSRTRADRRRSRWHAAAGTQPVEPATDPEMLLATAELQRAIAVRLVALDEPYRRTVIMRFYDGMSSVEIGNALGVSAGTVRWRIKVALARLRAELDTDRPGNRWSGLLTAVAEMPAVQPRSVGMLATPGVASLAIVGIICAGGWLSSRGPTASSKGGNPLRAATATAPNEDTSPWTEARAWPPYAAPEDGGPRHLALMPPSGPVQTLASCHAQLSRLRGEVSDAERRLRVGGRSDLGFTLGRPNPQAEARLQPELARVFRAESPNIAWTLACRTWACRLSVVEPPQARSGWSVALQSDTVLRAPYVGAPLVGMMFTSHPPVLDPETGELVSEEIVYLPLERPSGDPLLPGLLPAPPAAEARPETLLLCRSERRKLQRRLAVVRRTHEAFLDPRALFEAASANRTLTTAFAAELRALFGDRTPPDLEVDCRGDVCRFAAPTTAARDDMWRMPLRRNPQFARRFRQERALLAESYVRVIPAGWVHGRALLAGRMASLDLARDLDACSGRSPHVRGPLVVDLEIPATGELNRDGETGTISLRAGGELRDTDVGVCARAAIERWIVRPALPAGVVSGYVTESLDFPRTSRK